MRAPFCGDVRLMHVLGTFGACVVCVVSEGCETCYHLQVYNKTHSSGHSNFQLDKINLLNSLIGEDFRQIAQCAWGRSPPARNRSVPSLRGPSLMTWIGWLWSPAPILHTGVTSGVQSGGTYVADLPRRECLLQIQTPKFRRSNSDAESARLLGRTSTPNSDQIPTTQSRWGSKLAGRHL